MINEPNGIPARLSVHGILGYFRKARRKVPKCPEGKELLINMADAREIEYTLVPNTKGKLDLWKHFSLRKRKTDGRIDANVAVCKQCNSVVTRVGDTSNMSTHMKRRHAVSLLGSPVGNKRKADTFVHISRYAGIYRYFIPVWT